MGFFKNIFKRKEGGTAIGNLLRGGASAMTGGMMGNGSGLQKWEQEQELARQRDVFDTMVIQSQTPQTDYKAIGQNLVNEVFVPAAASGSGNSPKAGESILIYSAKKHWYWVAGFLLAVIGFTWYVTKPKGNKLRLKR